MQRLNHRYRIVRPIASGTDGVVVLAEDGDRQLAIKQLRLATDPDSRHRLTAEFTRLAALDHPSLVKVHDLDTVRDAVDGFEAGSLFFTADFIDGLPIDRALADQRGRDRDQALVRAGHDAALALAHLHAAGLVHCDIKPANLLVRGRGAATSAVLVDLGLGTLGTTAGVARGTPLYMAPEALAGWAEPRSDLYGLAVTLVSAYTGVAPTFGQAVELSVLPPVVRSLFERMLATDPDDRPSSAWLIADAFGRAGETLDVEPRAVDGHEPSPTVLPPRMCGRDGALAAVCSALDTINQHDRPRAIRLVGPPGSGRGAVMAQAIRRHQLRCAEARQAAPWCVLGSGDQIAHALGVDDKAPRSPAAHALSVLERAADRAATGPIALFVDGDSELGRALVELAVHDPDCRRARLLIVSSIDAARPPPGDPDIADIVLDPLDADQVADIVGSMLARPIERAWASRLAALVSGLPARVVGAVYAGAQLFGPAELTAMDPGELVDPDHRDQLICRQVAALPGSIGQLLEAAAVLGTRAPVAAVAALCERELATVYAELAAALPTGLFVFESDQLHFTDSAASSAIDAALPAPRRRALHRAAVKWLESSGPSDPLALAEHLAITGPQGRAAAAALEAAEYATARGQHQQAVHFATLAVQSAPADMSSQAHVVHSECAARTGRYQDACDSAERAARTRDPDVRRRAIVALARGHQLAGRLDQAEAALGRIADQDIDDTVRALLARLAIVRARYRQAADVAGRPSAEPRAAGDIDKGRATRIEAAGLALLYLGDYDGAETELAALEAEARSGQDHALVGRALGLRGMVAQTRGDITAAARLYTQASELARRAGDLHAASVYDINQATAHAERGRHGLAILAVERALARLRALGNVVEVAAALYNRGIAQLALGDVDGARKSAERARLHADERGAPEMDVWAQLLTGDVARRAGKLADARAAYQGALASAGAAELVRPTLLAHLYLAEVLAELGDGGFAEHLQKAEPLARTDDDRDRLELSRARIALCGGISMEAPLADRLGKVADDSRKAGRLDTAWRADAVAARLYLAVGDRDRAEIHASRARAELDRIAADEPEWPVGGGPSDADGHGLSAVLAQLRASPEPTESGAVDLRHVRRLLTLSRRLNSELRLASLLDDVIDTAIELTSAERGFLLMHPAGSKDNLDIVVARNIDRGQMDGDEGQLSRSIAERAARTSEVQLTVDAAFDERFGAAESVAALKLRSVLAVPLRQKGRVIGTIYVDHRYRSGAFDQQAVELACELADIAAVAIENARLAEDNRRHAEEIDRLNRQLAADLDKRETELAQVRSKLVTGDGRSALEHPYSDMVGRSPAMLELLSTLDRVIDSHLPVVLFGESGTGKELVARALHRHGRRSEKPFVAINCGALPEQLLESELFGHVRGAFTGAERDKRGLFEVADGGTLFLDEIADTGPAMQSKLLRVLQEGELRRVGDERTRRIDVRIIAASNRDLAEMVERGTFRQDLFYRLNVLRIHMPPLRQRVADIPELAVHLLDRLGAAMPITRAAMSHLCAYDWPGNVRELENELARASALADGRIDVDDLSPHIASARTNDAPAAPPGRELEIKPQVEALERSLVEQAMERTSGNQTAAAKLLGLSRYGLQKKLRRYGLAP